MVNWLVFGLGNPGTKYIGSRHNVGKDILSYALTSKNDDIKRASVTKWKKNSHCVYQTYEITTDDNVTHAIIVAKSESYMNLSGVALKNAAEQFGIETQNIIVVYDDYSLLFGGIKISKNTSHGGHNGIKSIIENIGENFIRFRIGINGCKNNSNDESKVDLGEYVLEKFTFSEHSTIDKISRIVVSIIEDLVTSGIQFAQNKYNKLIY